MKFRVQHDTESFGYLQRYSLDVRGFVSRFGSRVMRSPRPTEDVAAAVRYSAVTTLNPLTRTVPRLNINGHFDVRASCESMKSRWKSRNSFDIEPSRATFFNDATRQLLSTLDPLFYRSLADQRLRLIPGNCTCKRRAGRGTGDQTKSKQRVAGKGYDLRSRPRDKGPVQAVTSPPSLTTNLSRYFSSY